LVLARKGWKNEYGTCNILHIVRCRRRRRGGGEDKGK
jgi:hypothetical protein